MLDNLFGGIAAVFGVPAVLGAGMLIIRLFMLMLGGHHGMDMHDGGGGGGDLHHGDTDQAFHALSFQGIVTFAAGFGWSALAAMHGLHLSFPIAFLIGALGGVGMVWLMGLMMKAIFDSQSSGNLPLEAALSREGSVYLNVPESGKGRGQVKMTIENRLRIYDAVAESDPLPTGTRVKVTRINDDHTLTVARA